ncbi:Ig-like domain-containing protein [Cryobacterium glaciale]|nr:Ig-like domain-containing protein [Cryobacterium glaciale]
MSAYLDLPVIAHEVGHNIGAVQDSAPHSTRGGHCYDEADLMCYDDGGLYFAAGGTLTFTCAGLDSAIDCHDEDYYYPGTPPASNYLATHWNTSNSGFLTPVASSAVPPTVTAKSPLTLATRVAQTANVTATFSTAVQGLSSTTMRLKNPVGTVLAATGWSFTTGPAPTISVRTPASGATGASRTASVSVTFSEGMAGVTASTFKLKNTTTGAAISAVVSRSGSTNQWILNPSGTLAANTNFTVTVTGGASAVRDLAGNPVSTSVWKFSTGS